MSEEFRREVARGVGDYFRRCLDGVNRTGSGRDRLNLQSRVYVCVRDVRGTLHNPVSVHHSWVSIRDLVKEGDFLGESIFAGFLTLWEAQLAVLQAGLDWPPST